LLISVRRRLVFLSLPKTATTSVEAALAPHCGVVVRNPPSLKHATYNAFMRDYAPILERKCRLKRSDYEVLCILREPMAWLHSWYRYRTREGVPIPERRTDKVTFSEFLEAYLAKPKPPFVRNIVDPFEFVTAKDGSVGVDRIFKYEDMEAFRRFASEMLQADIQFPVKNVSPGAPHYEVPEELLARVRERLAPAIRLWESL